jgi:hypothetical protein
MDTVVSKMKEYGFSDEEAHTLALQLGIKCIADFKRMNVKCLDRYPNFKTRLIRLRNDHVSGQVTLWYNAKK